MSLDAFFGPSAVLVTATVFLILFTLLGAFDGLYFHIYKFKLQRLPEAQLEHSIHAARGVLFVPIAALLFAVNSGGWLLWLALFLLAVDIALEVIDVLVEKEARALIGGIYPPESALHVTATAARVAAIALVLSVKPVTAWSLSSVAVLESYPPFLAWTGWLFTLGSGLGTLGQMISMWVVSLFRSPRRGYSLEGNPVEDYDVAMIYLALPLAYAMEFFLRLIRPTVTEKLVGGPPPDNAILYSFHRDAMLTLAGRSMTTMPNGAYVGYHGFASYFPTLHYGLTGVRAIRFKRDSAVSPKDQIIHEMREWNGPVGIRTDSGKPYGRVRASLVDFAAATGRPLVPVVQVASRFITIANHTVPLRHAHILTMLGQPISPEQLAGMTRDEARDLLQSRIDELKRAAETPPTPAPPDLVPGGATF